jgi:hypothetical protein
MKREMDSWRSFIERSKLLENREYIKYVLGIDIPLNESIHISPEVSKKIIQEQILLEGFFDQAVQKVKQAAGSVGAKLVSSIEDSKTWIKEFGDKVGLLFHSLWKIMKNPKELKNYLSILDKRNQIRKLPAIKEFTDNLVNLYSGTSFVQAASIIKSTYSSAIEEYDKMQTSWKKALVGSTLTVFIDYTISKFKQIIEKVNNVGATATDAAKEQLGNQVQRILLSFFQNSFGSLFSKASEYMSGVGVWAGWLGKIVGGIDYVASSLFGTTRDFTQTKTSPDTSPASSSPDVSPAQ